MFREFGAANARCRDAANRDARQAWIGVDMWAHAISKKKMPKLDTYLLKETPRVAQRQPYAAMISALVLLSEQTGFPMKKARLKRRLSAGNGVGHR